MKLVMMMMTTTTISKVWRRRQRDIVDDPFGGLIKKNVTVSPCMIRQQVRPTIQ